MVSEGNRKKKIMWQDITPVRPAQKSKRKKPGIINTLRSRLHLPPTTITKSYVVKLLHKRIFVIVGILIIVGIIAFIFFANQYNKPSDTQSDSSSTKSTGNLVLGSPKYTILLPTSKSLSDLGGGWVRDDAHPLFVYIDKIGTTKINVSEQPLPDNLRDDTNQKLANLAIDFGATEKITIKGNQVYIGSSSDGPQSVIFSINNLLILIKSDSKISNDNWVKYISNLDSQNS